MLTQLGKEVYFCNTERPPFPLTQLPCFDVIEFRQIYPESFDILVLIEGETEARTGQKHIDKYFMGFGGYMYPYYTINKAIMPIEIILKFIKRQAF